MSKEKETTQGWQCPICKTVYSPEIKECPKCVVKENSEKGGTQLLID